MRADVFLIVDDDDALRRMLVDYLTTQGYTALGVRSMQQGEEALRTDAFDLVLADLRLEDGSGLDLLKQLKQIAPQTVGILMTGYATMDTAVEAIRIGLFDYMIKPILPAQLDLVLQRLESLRQLQSENFVPPPAAADRGRGQRQSSGARSGLMQDILEMVKKVAQTHATVLIQGESGTGKEVVAHAIVQNSPRANMPFIKVNCAAVPETLLESEFFGHEKGAFTGAVQRREGRFETANGGTLLLDEIAEIPLSLQVKLLRVLQEREFERVGGNKTIRVDVRLIASTNRDLQEEVRAGPFPRGPFLPAQRGADQPAAAAAARATTSTTWSIFMSPTSRASTARTIQGVSPRVDGTAARLSLAGQRARTAEHARARGDHDAAGRPGGGARASPSPRRARHLQQHQRLRPAADGRRDGAAPDRLHAAADRPEQDARGGKARHQPAHAAQQAARLPRDGFDTDKPRDLGRRPHADARAGAGRGGVVTSR